MTFYIGIDPGKTGAIAVIDETGGLVGVFDMPLTESREFINTLALKNILDAPGRVLYIEKVHAMPTDSKTNLSLFMRFYGAIEAIADLTGGASFVRPQDWKRELDLIGPPAKYGTAIKRTPAERSAFKKLAKEKAVALAIELYPGCEQYLKRKKDHDRAEAILLAHYARVKTP